MVDNEYVFKVDNLFHSFSQNYVKVQIQRIKYNNPISHL